MMDSLFEASFSPLAATGKFLSKCGKCQVSLQHQSTDLVITSNYSIVHCATEIYAIYSIEATKIVLP
jgi:alpha-ketoglutarate-dependent taurine dioxygenase